MNRAQADIAGSLGGFSGELIDPGHSSYERARRMFNADIDRRPALIARCGDEADIKAAVRHARDRGLPLSVRCSGHSLAGHSSMDGGLMIDMSMLKRIEVDAERRRVRVRAGATWGELDAATQRFGLAVTGARNSTTGVVGVTLGGGKRLARAKARTEL
jgi:FAD/FMN-containing dehydrogenase